MSDHHAIMSLEAEFAGWMVYRQHRGSWLSSCFARRYSDGLRAEGEDWADLRDMIIRAIWREGES